MVRSDERGDTHAGRELHPECQKPEQHACERTYAGTRTQRELVLTRGADPQRAPCCSARRSVVTRLWYPRSRRSTQHVA